MHVAWESLVLIHPVFQDLQCDWYGCYTYCPMKCMAVLCVRVLALESVFVCVLLVTW